MTPQLPSDVLTESVSEPFPRLYARTQRFSLGHPRSPVAAPDDSRVVFLRTPSGTDRTGCLWVWDVEAGTERLVADPRALLADAGEEQLSPEERARRERSREGGAGIVAYATDRAVTRAAFALSSRLFLADLAGGEARELPAAAPVVDPRPDPDGRRVAYVAGGALRVTEADGSGDRPLVEPDGPDVTWGLAEFTAAENTFRFRGFWWSPEGNSLLVARVDESPVQRWHIAEPAEPAQAPVEVAYPSAGTPNAEVTLTLVDLDGLRRPVSWDTAEFPYLTAVHWSAGGPPLLQVQTRDQRTVQVLEVDVAMGATSLRHEQRDDAWVHLTTGVPAWTDAGRLVTVEDSGDTRRLCVDGAPVTPDGLQVDTVLEVGDGVLFTATDEPTQSVLWEWQSAGLSRLTPESGLHSGRRGHELLLISRSSLDTSGPTVRLLRPSENGRLDEVATLPSVAESPSLIPRVELLRTGSRELRTAVLLPTDWRHGAGKLPVLLDPYGGPHGQRVLAARNAYLSSQWLADQGFAVVIADGRGTPGRGPAWERAIAGDLAAPILEDQVDALHGAAEQYPDLDLSRVGIRGWSFGGYLAALAVLRRPDVFAAAIAGAPVTDWALYDTHYTERYLGTPQDNPEAYARTSLIVDAPRLERPLLLIHGLADDNVVAAHTLRLSSALLEAGRPHTVLPLSGVTHMTPQEVVAENLLLLQVAFLQQTLGGPVGAA